jgi:hypothetical protein
VAEAELGRRGEERLGSLYVISAAEYESPPEETQDDLLAENQFGIPRIYLGGADRYKIVYSDVAVKSRCVAGMANNA